MSTTLNSLLYPTPDKILEPTAGRVLIASPLLNDFYFVRSVVYIVEHNQNGTIGIILNHPKRILLNDVLPEQDKDHVFRNRTISIGGPCALDYLNILHTLPEITEEKESIQVAPGIFWERDLFRLKTLLKTKKVPTGSFRFYNGYSGWEPGQLEHEIGMHNWVIAESKIRWNMASPNVMWDKYVKSLGKKFEFWSQIPIEANLN